LLWEPTPEGVDALSAVLGLTSKTSGALLQSAINPTETYGGGALAVEAIVLSLNIQFNQAGLFKAGANNFGSLVYTQPGDLLSGLTVTDLLAVANQALAGEGVPGAYDFDRLAALLRNLNLAFRNRSVSDWAKDYLSAPSLTVQCSSQVPAPDASRVTAADTCSTPVVVSVLPDVVVDYVKPAQYTLARTWVATDAAGNTNSVTVHILVNDTKAPTLTAAPDRTVEAGTVWEFDQPTAADNCTKVTPSVLSTVTNTAGLVGGQEATAVTRTWVATDAAGNSGTCQQTITIVTLVPQDPPTIGLGPISQTIGSGNNATLTVTATGPGPLTYQWQLNGTNLAGATDSSYALNDTRLSDAGLYTVVVGNGGGTVTSPAAIVNVLPQLVQQLNNGVLRLSWPAPFILQSSLNANGPYTDVAGATSPYLYNVATGPRQFFRLRAQPFRLTTTPLPNRQYSITGPGIPGCVFIIQASSNLRDWVNISTNPSPITVVDTQAGDYPYRFYRAVLASTTVVVAPTLPVITAQPVSQVATYGNTATLTVTVTGTGPFTYQWRRNGTDIPGATGNSLTLNNLDLANSGSYTVVVTSAAGSVESQPALLTVAPRISLSLAGQGLSLSWPGSFILQAAADPAGPYADVAGATNPYLYDTQNGPHLFFRLRASP